MDLTVTPTLLQFYTAEDPKLRCKFQGHRVVASEHPFTKVCCSIFLTAVYLPALKKTHINPEDYQNPLFPKAIKACDINKMETESSQQH